MLSIGKIISAILNIISSVFVKNPLEAVKNSVSLIGKAYTKTIIEYTKRKNPITSFK